MKKADRFVRENHAGELEEKNIWFDIVCKIGEGQLIASHMKIYFYTAEDSFSRN